MAGIDGGVLSGAGAGEENKEHKTQPEAKRTLRRRGLHNFISKHSVSACREGESAFPLPTCRKARERQVFVGIEHADMQNQDKVDKGLIIIWT